MSRARTVALLSCTVPSAMASVQKYRQADRQFGVTVIWVNRGVGKNCRRQLNYFLVKYSDIILDAPYFKFGIYLFYGGSHKLLFTGFSMRN